MENKHYIDKITSFAQKVINKDPRQTEITPMTNCGIICCCRRQRIHRVPFTNPCLILVLKGKKTISNGGKTSTCIPGQCFGIPAPSSFDLANDPDVRDLKYMALVIPFEYHLVNRFRQLYSNFPDIYHSRPTLQIHVNHLLFDSIIHFLEIADAPEQDRDLIEHRLMEILLCLVKISGASHLLLSLSDQWSKRLVSLFLTDLAKSWRIQDACRLLAVSESTLRRNLRKENTSYQSLLDDTRLSNGLLQVQMSQLSIGQIAYNCGYQSASRFSNRFHQRFKLTPSQLRKTLTESD